MIKTENGLTVLDGKLTEICADLTVIIHEFRNALAKAGFEEEFIEKQISKAVTGSKYDEKELAKKVQESISVLLKEMFFGGVK